MDWAWRRIPLTGVVLIGFLFDWRRAQMIEGVATNTAINVA